MSGRCETLSLTVADVRFGGSLISARCGLHSVSRYADRAPIQASGSVFLEKFLDDALTLGVFALTEVVIANSSLPIDKVLRRPVLVVECLPDGVIAIDGDWVGHLQIARGVFYVETFMLERELRCMGPNHDQAGILIFCRPALH